MSSKLNKKIKILDYRFKKNLWADLLGLYKTKFLGQWMEFAELREYVYGDPIKHVDWKATAKTWSLKTRIYEQERDLNVLFLIDVDENMNFKSETKSKKTLAQEIFYSLAFSAISNNDNIWALFYNKTWVWDFINFKKHISQIYRIIELWDENNFNIRENNFDYTLSAFKEISNLKLKRNLIFVLTADTEIKNNNLLKLVWESSEIIYINIFDYFENNLNFSSTTFDKFLVKLGWIQDYLMINLDNKGRIKKYRNLRDKKLEDYKNFLQKNWADYLKIDTSESPYSKLLEFFSKR